MPNNKKHHYVPRFYLKRFSSNKKSICLYNITHKRRIINANLRNQCYKDYFYGKEGSTEDALSGIENEASYLFKKIDEYGCLPPPMTDDHIIMALFIIIQHGRTKYQADALDEMHDKMFKQTFKEKIEAEIEGVNLDDFIVGIEDVSQYAVKLLGQYYPLLLDLNYKLLVNKTDVEFVTCDNPVVLYNQLLSFRKIGSNTGLSSKGLQIFFPISPSKLIILYDTEIYRVGSESKFTIDITYTSDVYNLNVLQACSCYENIYFMNNILDVVSLHKKALPFLRKVKSNIDVFPQHEENKKRSEIVMSYQEDIISNFSLNCISLRKSAKRWQNKLRKTRLQPAIFKRESSYCDDFEEYSKIISEDKSYKLNFIGFLDQKYKQS